MLTVEGGPATPDRAARVRPFLLQEPVLHGIALSVLERGDPADLAVVDRDGEPVAAGLRTETKYLLSRAADPGAAHTLADDASRCLGPLSGWMGPRPEVRTFTSGWVHAAAGRAARLAMSMRIYTLDRLPAEPSVPGAYRPATAADADLLAGWRGAFTAETGAAGREGDGTAIERAIAEGTLRVWEDGGRVVSMAKSAGGAPDAVRVNLVYTPPELRRRGYASACVAALSAELLRAGRRYCYLYADLANPVSNSIYQRIGYRTAADVEDWCPAKG